MYRWIVTETGPNGEYEFICKSLEEAEESCRKGLEYWEELVRVNKVPERIYTIRKYKQDGDFSNE